MKTLAIETSCDDTSLAIVNNNDWVFQIEKIVMYSQIQQHIPYGWVLPEVASRLHSEKIVALINEIWLAEIEKVDFISVTTKPWLPGSLVVWRTTAHLLSEFYNKPLIEINHIHGHIFSILLERWIEDLELPLVVLTASWGHNDLYVVNKTNSNNINEENTEKVWPFIVKKIWYTLDDAAWEAFDKVSKMLGGPYPWGPWISEKALQSKGNESVQFKRIFLPIKDGQFFEFSFSGMKSQVSHLLDKYKNEWKSLIEQDICDVAYEFQEATVETLWKRLMKAAKLYWAKTVAIAWGVSANKRLTQYVEWLVDERNNSEYAEKNGLSVRFIHPAKNLYSTDNWAMIWVAWLLMNL